MFRAEQQIKIETTPEKVFDVYKDVESWSKWDIGLDFSELYGDFKDNSIGVIKPKQAPKQNRFELFDVVENKTFRVSSISLLCSFEFYHSLEEIQDGTTIVTHTVVIDGKFWWLSPIISIFGRFIGKKIEKELPTVLKNLKTLAEK